MTNEQIVAKFNPANAANLTAQDLLEMRQLTDQQIDALANAYPNQPTRRAYLRLYDTTKAENKQLFQLSTWQNLRNVRKFSNMKNLVAYDFIASAAAFGNIQRQAPQRATAGKATTSPKKVVVDLTAKEAAAELLASVPAKATTRTTKVVNVENKQAPAVKSVTAKSTKAATSPKKDGNKAAKTAPAANVEKSVKAAPADGSTEFTPV